MYSPAQLASNLSVTVLIMAGTIGCAHDVGTYKTLREARSPDGETIAQLVQRQSHAALSSDTFFAALSRDRLNEGSLRLANQDPKRPFLEVTHGQLLELRWTGPKQLEIICNQCGMQKIDVMMKRPVENEVSISYVGFPTGTAYDDK